MKISVCLASYNGEKYIEQQIQSILECLSENDELVVSDDGSRDKTTEIVKSFPDKNIRLIHNKNRGVVSNFKNAVDYAKGDIIVLADQDDVWLSNRLDKLKDLHQKYSVVVSNACLVDQDLKATKKTIFDIYRPTVKPIKVFFKNCFVGCSMSFTNEYVARFSAIPNDAPMHDWVLGLGACIKKDIVFDEEVRFLFRRHASNASTTGQASKNSVLQKLWNRLLLLKSLYLLLKK